MNYKFILREDMETKFKDDEFWYVYNKTDEVIIASQLFGDMESIAIVFQEKEDAETARFILSKATDAHGKELIVIAEKWRDIDHSTIETEGQYKWAAINHEQAQIFFEPASDLLRTREFEESQNKELSIMHEALSE